MEYMVGPQEGFQNQALFITSVMSAARKNEPVMQMSLLLVSSTDCHAFSGVG